VIHLHTVDHSCYLLDHQLMLLGAAIWGFEFNSKEQNFELNKHTRNAVAIRIEQFSERVSVLRKTVRDAWNKQDISC
jgi:hypothetical protein